MSRLNLGTYPLPTSFVINRVAESAVSDSGSRPKFWHPAPIASSVRPETASDWLQLVHIQLPASIANRLPVVPNFARKMWAL